MPRQNIAPADYPQAVLQQIEQLAQNIVVARKRRGESRAQWAKKLGISVPTMTRIERGDPSVAMASYVMCMWLINQAAGLADLIAPQRDHAVLEKQVAQLRARRNPSSGQGLHPAPIAALQALKVAENPAPSLRTSEVDSLSQPKNLPYPKGAKSDDNPKRVMQATSKRPELATTGPAAGLAALMAKTPSRSK